jgi:hypothetical protein
MPTPIQDCIARVRTKLFVRVSTRQDISDSDITSHISSAVSEYSRFRPRNNVVGQISQNTGSRYILLPIDFMSASYRDLALSMTGNLPNFFNYPTGGISIFDSNTIGVRVLTGTEITTIGGWRGDRIRLGNVLNTDLTTDDNGRWTLVLKQPASQTFTRDLTYTAMHSIDATKNTIPVNDRDRVENLAVATALESLLITLALEQDSKRVNNLLPTLRNEIDQRKKQFYAGLQSLGARVP